MDEQSASGNIKWCDKCLYKFLKDLIIPLIILCLGLLINSKIGRTERHLKMVELLNDRIEGDYEDIEYLNQLFDVVDHRFAKKLKGLTDYRLMELKFKDFSNSDGSIRDQAINDLKDFHKRYPDHVIKLYIDAIPDSIQTIGWKEAICIAKGMWLLEEWKGDSTMYKKVKSFEQSSFYGDKRIKDRIQGTLNDFILETN